MNKCFTVSCLVFMMATTVSFAQIDKGKTDLQKANLKGNVSTVIESKRTEEEKWGEIKVNLETLQIDYYDKNGYRTLSALQPWDNACILRRFNRDEKGKLLSVDYYEYDGSLNDHNYSFNQKAGHELYEYDADDNLKSITFENTNVDYRYTFSYFVEYYYNERPEIDVRRLYGFYKLIFRYNSPKNYTVIACDKDGNTLKRAIVSENGRKLDNDLGICALDQFGRMTSRGGAIVANNGAMSYSYFYGYNKQGDLVLESSKEEGIKQVDIAPWLAGQYKYTGDTVYEYSYDSNNNWTVKKVFKTRSWGLDEEYSEARARSIEYGNFTTFDMPESQPEDNRVFSGAEKRQLDDIQLLIKNESYKDAFLMCYYFITDPENSNIAKSEACYFAGLCCTHISSSDELNSRMWVATDFLELSIKIDPTLTKAQELLKQVKTQYPTSSDAFMYGLKEGDPYNCNLEGTDIETTVRLK